MESDQTVKENKDVVPRKDIYYQLSDVALRHRNYETETARWYTTILVAILGFILSAKSGTPQSALGQLLSENFLGQIALSAVVFAITFSSCYAIQFYHRQHSLLEKYIDTLLEQEEVNKRKSILNMPKLKPRFLLTGTQIFLALIIIVVIFIKL